MSNAGSRAMAIVILALAAIIIFYSSACSNTVVLSEEEETFLEELKQHVIFTEDLINDELFSSPFYFVYLDGKDIGGINRARRLSEAKTVVFVKTDRDQVGVWVDSSGRKVGGAYSNYVSICLIDISTPANKQVFFGESHPGDIQGKGKVYINGEEYTRSSSHYGETTLLNTLLKTATGK